MMTHILKAFDVNYSMFVLVDMQEKFSKSIEGFDDCVDLINRFLKACHLLDIPVVVTEQYPKGLGHIVSELKNALPDNTPVFEKNTFSCWGSKDFASLLSSGSTETIILTGIETHICVQQTALEALERGYNVILVQDCVGSNKLYKKELAIDLLRQKGVIITSFESLLFAWIKSSQHPEFKKISKLVQ
ncbi:MAG: hydrolase [Verrucomicrobiota bacterium]|nr:hydrolase [Verrucomicrobiota bacterium]